MKPLSLHSGTTPGHTLLTSRITRRMLLAHHDVTSTPSLPTRLETSLPAPTSLATASTMSGMTGMHPGWDILKDLSSLSIPEVHLCSSFALSRSRLLLHSGLHST